MIRFSLALTLLPAVYVGAIQKQDDTVSTYKGWGDDFLRNFLSGVAPAVLPKNAALKIEVIPTVLGIPGSRRIKYRYGPYKLKAANNQTKVGNSISMDKGGTGYLWMVGDDFPRDITALDVIAEVQNENFERATIEDGIYNHHVAFLDISPAPKPALACEAKSALVLPVSVFAGGITEVGGMRYAATKGGIKSGYHLSKNRKIMNMVDVVNYNNESRTVYISAEIEYLPGKASGYLNARQERVDPGLCGGQQGLFIHPPEGVNKFSVNSSGIVIAREGWFVNAKGHVHDGGVNIVLKVNDKVVCDSKAIYGGEGHTSTGADGKVWETIRETLTCDVPFHVVKGDKVFMQANYDLDLHPPRQQGGHVGMRMKRSREVVGGDSTGSKAAEQMALMITHFAYAR